MWIFTPQDLIKLLLAVLVGGIIGFDRELHTKAAGLRTITLITVGATIFTLVSERFTDSATSRVAANIVNGIGFLGAGVILFAEGKLKGLTTASSIWVAAALGMAVGLGQYVLSLTAAVLVVVILELFAPLDLWLDSRGHETLTYEITFVDNPGKDEQLEALFHAHRMAIRTHHPMRQNGLRSDRWEIDGRARDHLALAEELLADEEVKELRY